MPDATGVNELRPAFLLHAREYRDTSLLVELFTPDAGRISAVAKGARRMHHGVSQRAILQPLQPLWVQCVGSRELQTLRSMESRAPAITLRGNALFSAFYLNELLCRLLHRDDAHASLFFDYENTLNALAGVAPLDITLRHFELQLLESLGYGLSLTHEGATGEPIQAHRNYVFDTQSGLVITKVAASVVFSGADLLDFACGNFTETARRSLKYLCRMALRVHLGDKPLQSRRMLTKA